MTTATNKALSNYCFQAVHSASHSAVKTEALEKFIAKRGTFAQRLACVAGTVDTGCPQPVGIDSARVCMGARMRAFDDEPAMRGDVYIAIENYIEQRDGLWYDKCAVTASFVDKQGFWRTKMAISGEQFLIPQEYAPTNASQLDIQKPCGFSQTVGERIYAAHPECPKDNWPRFLAGDEGADRIDQIIDALERLDFD